MGGGSIRLGESDEPDRDEGDLENQSSSRNRKRRCSGSPLRCLASNNPIVDAAASAYRATAQTAGRVSNSAQSRLRSTFNSAQSRFGQNNGSNNEQDSDEEIGMGSIGSSVSEVSTKAEFDALMKDNDNNLYKVLLAGYNINISLLYKELGDWGQQSIKLSLGLDGTATLKEVQKTLGELAYFLHTESKALAEITIKILVILHFPPDNQNMHNDGNMTTGGANNLPINPTLRTLYHLATIVLMAQYGVSYQVALIIAMNTIVPTDVIPFTLPYDAARTGNADYIKAKEDSVEATKLLIDNLARKYGFTHTIVLGDYPWEFYNTHLKDLDSFENITLLQKFALVHPSAILISSTIRQVFELVFVLCAMFHDLSEVDPVRNITLEDDITILNDAQCVLDQYIKANTTRTGQYFYGAWYNGTLVLLEHSANKLESLIKKQVSSLPSSRPNLKRRWGRATSSEFPKTEDLVARLSGVTNQGKTISYYHLDIGVFLWKDCLKDELPEGSLRDYGLPPGVRNTYKNITMGVQNDAVLGDWGAYVEANAKVQQTRNSQLVARTSASLTAAADDDYDDEIGDGFD